MKINDATKVVLHRKTIGQFCSEMGVSYQTYWGYLNRSAHIPLFILQALEKDSNIALQSEVDELTYGAGATQRRSHAVSCVTPILAKMLGAFAADGHLKQRTVARNGRTLTHYELVFREQYFSNMQALANWITALFGIPCFPQVEKNHHFIYISNKIIFRQFTEFFGFYSGRKTETVRAPLFIRTGPLNVQAAFVGGVLMFDGYVNKNNGTIELYSKSKMLVSDISSMLTRLQIPPDYINKTPDKYGRHRLIIRKQKKLVCCLSLFEPKTEKWERLNNCIHKFRKTQQEQQEDS